MSEPLHWTDVTKMLNQYLEDVIQFKAEYDPYDFADTLEHEDRELAEVHGYQPLALTSDEDDFRGSISFLNSVIEEYGCIDADDICDDDAAVLQRATELRNRASEILKQDAEVVFDAFRKHKELRERYEFFYRYETFSYDYDSDYIIPVMAFVHDISKIIAKSAWERTLTSSSEDYAYAVCMAYGTLEAILKDGKTEISNILSRTLEQCFGNDIYLYGALNIGSGYKVVYDANPDSGVCINLKTGKTITTCGYTVVKE